MGQPMKCFTLLSLEEMAVRKLTAILWNRSDILASVMKFGYQNSATRAWRTIVDKVKNQIVKLDLPELLREQMVGAVGPIGLEIESWERFHRQTFDISCIEIFEQDSAKVCFTTAGTVDDRRTAHIIVRCDKINVVQRYVIACSYWLEDCIPILWRKLTEKDKDYFYKKNPAFQGLEFSWPRIFIDGQSNLDSYLRKLDRNLTSFNQSAFEHSAQKGYKETAEYFFQKLLPGERGDSLMRSMQATAVAVRTAPDYVQGRLRNVLHYLLSIMTPEQKIEIVKTYPVQVMSCFFDWPRRELFSENAGLIWPFVLPNHYKDLLKTFFRYDTSHFPDFFKESPLDFRKYVLGPDPLCYSFSIRFLVAFLDSKDSESIQSMFRSADVEGRVQLVCNNQVLRLFHDSLARGDWHLVEMCMREATLSRKERRNLKNKFLSCLNRGLFSPDRFSFSSRANVTQMNHIYPKLKKFFDFLDGTDTSTEEKKKGRKRKFENCSSE